MNVKQILTDWSKLTTWLSFRFDSDKPDLQTVLFLIGVQELGQGPCRFTKRQKEELMHIAVCKLLSLLDFYTLIGKDQDGWPLWEISGQLPSYSPLEQEYLLKSLAVSYFEQEQIISFEPVE